MDGDVAAAELSEATAVMRTRVGFEDWVRPHWLAMAHFAARQVGAADVEDVVQDALTVAWRKRDRFDPGRGSARSWLLALVADQARKTHRRRLRRSRALSAPDTSVDPQVDRAVDVERAIGRLSGRQKLAVDLYYYLDLSSADVAAVMGCTEGTAKSTLADARARLREYLGDDLR